MTSISDNSDSVEQHSGLLSISAQQPTCIPMETSAAALVETSTLPSAYSNISEPHSMKSSPTDTGQYDTTSIHSSSVEQQSVDASLEQDTRSESMLAADHYNNAEAYTAHANQYERSHESEQNVGYSADYSYPRVSSSADNSNTNYPHPPQSSMYSETQNWEGYNQHQYSTSQYDQARYDSYSNSASYSGEAEYEYNRSTKYYEGYSGEYPDSYDQRSWNKGDYQYDYSNSGYSQQHSQTSYSQGDYSYQGSYNPRGYGSYSQSSMHAEHDSRYYKDKASGPQQNYHDDRSYNKHKAQYDTHSDQRRSYPPRHDDHGYQRDPRTPSDRDTQPRRGTRTGDTFVQRRSAMFKRAEVQQVSRSNSKSTRGPQIVQPHRLTEIPDSKKNDKPKQPDGSFPKRNLDSFKIPKKKNPNSAPSPVKKPVLIPALDVKQEHQTDQLRSSPVKASDKNIDVTTSLPTSKPVDEVNTANSSSNSSSVPPAVSTGKKKQVSSSINKARATTSQKTMSSAKKNIIPSVLSTLPPKTLLSLAATLQKTLEQASAQKNTSESNSSIKSVPTCSALPISKVPASVSPATSVYDSVVSGVTKSLLPVSNEPIVQVQSKISPPGVLDSLAQLSSLFSSKLLTTLPASPLVPPAMTIGSSTATPTSTSGSIVSAVATTSSMVAASSILISASNPSVTTTTSSDNMRVSSIIPHPPASTGSETRNSAGVVLATVIGSSDAAQSTNTNAKLTPHSPSDINLLLPKNSSQLPIDSLSSLVDAICSSSSAAYQTKSVTATSNVNLEAVPHQESILQSHDKEIADTTQETQKLSRVNQTPITISVGTKRTRSPERLQEANTDAPSLKRLKSEKEQQSMCLDYTTPTVSSYGGLQVEKENLSAVSKPTLTSDKSDMKPLLEGEQMKAKLEVKEKTSTRRRSASKSKKKIGASKHTGRNASTVVCCLCHKCDSELNLGFLFGPYKPKVAVASSSEKEGATGKPGEGLTDLWIHEDCAVWTPGVCLLGGQLIGLGEAMNEVEKMICILCKATGATLCCSTHNCKNYYHYHCAREACCFFDDEKYLITCPKHSSKNTN